MGGRLRRLVLLCSTAGAGSRRTEGMPSAGGEVVCCQQLRALQQTIGLVSIFRSSRKREEGKDRESREVVVLHEIGVSDWGS